jgi:hypothetical protein
VHTVHSSPASSSALSPPTFTPPRACRTRTKQLTCPARITFSHNKPRTGYKRSYENSQSTDIMREGLNRSQSAARCRTISSARSASTAGSKIGRAIADEQCVARKSATQPIYHQCKAALLRKIRRVKRAGGSASGMSKRQLKLDLPEGRCDVARFGRAA